MLTDIDYKKFILVLKRLGDPLAAKKLYFAVHGYIIKHYDGVSQPPTLTTIIDMIEVLKSAEIITIDKERSTEKMTVYTLNVH